MTFVVQIFWLFQNLPKNENIENQNGIIKQIAAIIIFRYTDTHFTFDYANATVVCNCTYEFKNIYIYISSLKSYRIFTSFYLIGKTQIRLKSRKLLMMFVIKYFLYITSFIPFLIVAHSQIIFHIFQISTFLTSTSHQDFEVLT